MTPPKRSPRRRSKPGYSKGSKYKKKGCFKTTLIGALILAVWSVVLLLGQSIATHNDVTLSLFTGSPNSNPDGTVTTKFQWSRVRGITRRKDPSLPPLEVDHGVSDHAAPPKLDGMRFEWRKGHPELSHTIDSKTNLYDAIYVSTFLANTQDSLAATSLFEQLTNTEHLTGHIFYSTIGIPPTRALCQSPKCHHLEHFTEGDDFVALTALYDHCLSHPSHTVAFMHNHESPMDGPPDQDSHLRKVNLQALIDSDGCATMPASCNVCSARFLPLPHFHSAGNMFAARCEYVVNLIDPIYFKRTMLEVAASAFLDLDQAQKWHPNTINPMTLSSNPRLGTGRYANSHWIHSHPGAAPCDTFPLVEGLLLTETFQPAMAMAPRFPFGTYWTTPSPSNTQAKLPKEPWLLLEGREHEWLELYDGLPQNDSWINGFYCNMSPETSVCDTLWKGDVAGQPVHKDQQKVHIVVSHCGGDLHWIKDYTAGFSTASITIFSKCGQAVVGAPKQSTIKITPNVGRCDHTYAMYMSDLVDGEQVVAGPNDIVLFLKDTTAQNPNSLGPQLNFYDVLRIASSRGFACLQTPHQEHSIFHETSVLVAYKQKKYQRLDRDRTSGGDFTSSYEDLYDWAEQLGFAHPRPLTPVCYKGSFATTVEMIQSRGNLWRKMEESLARGDNIEESHFAERSWAALLSYHIVPDKMTILQKASSMTLGTADDIMSRKRGFWGPLSNCDLTASKKKDAAKSWLSAEWLKVAMDSSHTYTVCNGLGNQLLAHAGNIAYAITHKKNLLIPNAYIVNGAQTMHNVNNRLMDVTPSNSEYAKLSDIFDTDALIEFIESFGITAALVPYRDETHESLECSWMKVMSNANPVIATKVLAEFKPSALIGRIVDTVQAGLDDENAVCVHHRDGEDWKAHCSSWETIPDGVWRHNCMNDPGRTLAEDVHSRILPGEKLPPIFYVGDHNPPPDLEKFGFPVVTRSQIIIGANHLAKQDYDGFNNLAPSDDSVLLGSQKLKEILSNQDRPCPPSFRDICAVVDFLACSSMKHFVGNSVSTWSALQIAQRFGEATWYNSRSVPLGNTFRAYTIPIVYTYTEQSAETGKFMLMTSIQSCKLHNPNSPIHVLYHGTSDKLFLAWLEENFVIVHAHKPAWIPLVTSMFQHGNVKKSHLFEHIGNYIGTWQRIDIPLYINAEYVLLLDCDTVVAAPFTYADFGLEMTKSIAFSAEMTEDSDEPWNAGVALLNIPYLRETYDDFLEFIGEHKDNSPFNVEMKGGWVIEAPSDQGAYLAFYADTKKFMDRKFNVKPYYTHTPPSVAKIIHYHGAKPHDYVGKWLGRECSPAVRFLCERKEKDMPNLCWSLKSFADAIVMDGGLLLKDYCKSAFLDDVGSLVTEYGQDSCFKFFSVLSQSTHEEIRETGCKQVMAVATF